MNNQEKTFLKNFIHDFKDGDLIYGTSSGRIDFILAVKKPKEEKIYVAVDEMNFKAIHNRTGEYNTSKLNKDPQAKAHFEYLESHDKYHPASAIKSASENMIDTYAEYLKVVKGIRIKRACKGGILNVIESASNRIHFVLRDFDYKRAFDKVGEQGKNAEIQYTNSEFRLIYRIWRASPDIVDKKVMFWDESGKKILATDYFKSIQKEISYTPKHEDGIIKLRHWANQVKVNAKERSI